MPLAVHGIHFGSTYEQKANHGHIVLLYCQVQGSGAEIVLCVQVCTLTSQKSGGIKLIAVHGMKEGRFIPTVGYVHIGPPGNQVFHDINIAGLGGIMQGAETFLVAYFHLRAGFHQ